MTQPNYKHQAPSSCRSCGFQSPLFPEVTAEEAMLLLAMLIIIIIQALLVAGGIQPIYLECAFSGGWRFVLLMRVL